MQASVFFLFARPSHHLSSHLGFSSLVEFLDFDLCMRDVFFYFHFFVFWLFWFPPPSTPPPPVQSLFLVSAAIFQDMPPLPFMLPFLFFVFVSFCWAGLSHSTESPPSFIVFWIFSPPYPLSTLSTFCLPSLPKLATERRVRGLFFWVGGGQGGSDTGLFFFVIVLGRWMWTGDGRVFHTLPLFLIAMV